jgi:WD40 repeat protein
MSCAISPDGQFIVSASFDKTLTVWDVATFSERAILIGHTRMVTMCIISPDGKFIVSISDDETLKVWDLNTGQHVTSFHTDGWLSSCAWHPDGKHLIAGGIKGIYFLRFVQ